MPDNHHITIIGTGSVAHHLATALAMHYSVAVVGRNTARVRQMNAIENVHAFHWDQPLPDTQLFILAVSDDAIRQVALDLAKRIDLQSHIVHTSGTKSLEEIPELFGQRGIFYPLQTISIHQVLDWSTVPILLTTERDESMLYLKKVAQKLSHQVREVTDLQRKHLHLAAVISNNLCNHLLHLAKSYCEDHDVDFSLLHPLLQESIQKAIKMGPYDAQTGPARRYDENTIRAHEELLTEDPLLQEIYSLITESIHLSYIPK